MQNKQLPPFNRGDEVIDDNAEIGYVLENYIDATWDAAGNLTNWHTRIHYRWDQPSYGLTRVVSEGEISLLTQRAADWREVRPPAANANRSADTSKKVGNMLKFYDCKVCETPCIGMPFDGEIYDKEVCSPECLAQLEAAEHHAHQTGFPPNHRDEPFCECDVCMGFVSRANRPQVA